MNVCGVRDDFAGESTWEQFPFWSVSGSHLRRVNTPCIASTQLSLLDDARVS